VCATLPDPDLGPSVDDDEVEAEAETFVDADADADDNAMDETPDEPMALDDPPAQNKNPAAHSPSFLPTLLEPLLALIQPTELSFSVPSPHPPTTSALSAIHVAAFECLSNAFLALAASPAAAAADVQVGQRVWAAVWAALAGAGNPADAARGSARAAVWDVAVGVLWAVGSIWPGKIVSGLTSAFRGLKKDLC
jgi:hypothetical protein